MVGGRNKEVRSEGKEKVQGRRIQGTQRQHPRAKYILISKAQKRQEHRKHKHEMLEVHNAVDTKVIFS